LTDVWSTYATVWAEIEPRGGREQFEAKQLNATIDLVVKIRYLSGLEPKMRISWSSRTFDIQSVINSWERNKEMIIACKEYM
jgi:SPP1 family predicted phage head-tail adaptor